MKSLTAVCQSGASAMPAINSSGRISRQNSNHHHHQHRDGENAEMKMYLSKLKDLVPFMPKNRKLSKLEIIQHVIDYICDLQSELETHPEINSFDAATALSLANGNHHHMSHLDDEDMSMEDRLAAHLQQTASSVQVRQPLATRQSPNTILNSSQNNNAVINSVILSNSQAAVQHHQQQQQQQHQQQQQQYSHATAPAVTASTEKQTVDNKNSRQHC
ncbi:protein extra-macrochaetae [Eupeodes corollae]|uniref:protein extra-macrochaetae n=1 Tax=Eupeodes corollae TaxID=290404 RepID=UPI0024908231|nr:protein extra-macrochaetae [Eupeodes corollae]